MKQLELDSFECSVSIPSLHFYFIANESNKEASQNRAFHYMIDYLKQLAKNIKGTIPINKPLYKYEPQGCSMNTHGIRLPTPPASEKSRRASTSSVASSKKSGSAGLFVIEHVLRLDFSKYDAFLRAF